MCRKTLYGQQEPEPDPWTSDPFGYMVRLADIQATIRMYAERNAEGTARTFSAVDDNLEQATARLERLGRAIEMQPGSNSHWAAE
jgi:hypothetical protein